MAAFGLKFAEEPEEPSFGVWPENWDALGVFLRMQTQWRVGMAGPIGLVYEALPTCLEAEAVARERWPEVIDAVQVMEREALRLARERRG